jgi:hypothetical protein
VKSPLAQILIVAVVFAGSAFATHTYLRHADQATYDAKVRQSYVDALIRDFTRDADFLATQIEEAVADSIRLEALIARIHSDHTTIESVVTMLQTELGPVVDGRNPLGFGIMHSLHKSGEFNHWPKDIRNRITNILELHNDIRFATEHIEWLVVRQAAWKGDDSATEMENAFPRAFGLLMLKGHSLKTLTEKRRHILTETNEMLALLNETKF